VSGKESLVSLPPDAFTIPGISHHWLDLEDIRLHYVEGGNDAGPPLMLLHGFPQSWVMWRKVLPLLLASYHVIAVDLPGYGDSAKPDDPPRYDKGRMAADIRAVARHLALPPYLLVGHDRGARVARRYALDYPEDLVGAALLDILPAEYVYHRLSAAEVARRYWHWVFHIVPTLPEQLITGREEAYLTAVFMRDPDYFGRLRSDAAWTEYLRAFRQPGAVAAMLNDYRATYRVDVPRYQAEREAVRRIDMPVLLLWGERGNLGGQPVLDIWREVASDIRGVEIAGCGHYLPEEQPEIVTRHILRFAVERFAQPESDPELD
jgi:pimeloyl-ACP methyl ester carboxylesterase